MWNAGLKFINRAIDAITMGFVVIMVVIIFLQIASRAVLGSSFPWTEEAARFLMIWVIYLGAGIAFKYGAHISIESFVPKFPLGLQKLAYVLIGLIAVSFFVILFFTGLEISSKTMVQRSPALGLPMGYVYYVMPISAVLQLLNIVDVTVNYLKTGNMVRGEY